MGPSSMELIILRYTLRAFPVLSPFPAVNSSPSTQSRRQVTDILLSTVCHIVMTTGCHDYRQCEGHPEMVQWLSRLLTMLTDHRPVLTTFCLRLFDLVTRQVCVYSPLACVVKLHIFCYYYLLFLVHFFIFIFCIKGLLFHASFFYFCFFLNLG